MTKGSLRLDWDINHQIWQKNLVAMTLKVLRVFGHQTRTFRPPWAESTICDITIGNFYVFSGTDGLSRNKRENILAEVIPRILIKKALRYMGWWPKLNYWQKRCKNVSKLPKISLNFCILIASDLFTKMLKYFQDIISQIVAVEPPALTELTTGVTCPWWTPRTCLWPSPTT